MKQKTTFKETEIGVIPEDWEVKKLSQSGVVITGKTPPTKEIKFWNGKYPFVTPTDIKGFDVRYSYDVERFLSEEWVKVSKSLLLPKDSVCFVCIGSTIGKMCLLKEPSFTNQQINSITVNNNNDPKFIFYQLRNSQERIKKEYGGGGAAKEIISKSTFEKIPVSLPDINEQRTITGIFSSLDDKIELNRKMNLTLEKIGQALFKSWFVDFDFPNKDGKPYRSSGGEMVDSELGEIPEEWEVKPFSEVIDVNPRRKITKGSMAKKVSMSDLKRWQSWINSWTKEVYSSGSVFQNGDILFARITPCLEQGKTAFVSFLDNNEVSFGSTEFIVLGPKRINSSPYIFFLAIIDNIRDEAIASMSGTSGRQRVPNDFFAHQLIVVPPGSLVEIFDKILKPIMRTIENNAREISTLARLRDCLLPRLMSGRIRVSDPAVKGDC